MSVNFTVGVSDDTRISSKVLKPPGGGSSDIFGTTEAAGSNSNGGNKKQFSSQFSLGNDEDVATAEPQRKSSVDSIDGASTTSSQTSTTNGSPNTSEPNTPRSGTPLLNGPIAYDNHHVLPTPSRLQGRRAQGNPVTGVGYSAEAKKEEETPRRQRVPPGGFSSKLW